MLFSSLQHQEGIQEIQVIQAPWESQDSLDDQAAQENQEEKVDQVISSEDLSRWTNVLHML